MQMSVTDVAGLLCVPEDTVDLWIRTGGLPARKADGDFRLNRAEVLGWAAEHRLEVSPEVLCAAGPGDPEDSLAAALRRGGIHFRLPGRTGKEALRSAVEALPLGDRCEREALLAVLLARESLGSTGIGDGIALPHARNPIVLHLLPPVVSLGFLESPVEFGSLDGLPVHTLFLICSPSVSAHLQILSHLNHALRDAGVRGALDRREDADRILEAFAHAEARANPSAERRVE